MMTRRTRPLAESERRDVFARTPWFAFRTRRDVRGGTVEVATFDVQRVWPLISCLGRGCCPYTWLIDTGDEYVYFRSWELLPFIGEMFPGSEVTIERLPSTGHIVTACASGPPVAVQPHLERPWEVFDWPGGGDSRILPRSSVRIR